MCWYDGILFNFVDEQTGEPTDYILQLENGGGKSTLLAGIFSSFETRQDRFLKHLQESRNRFSEYFSPDGLPGFILIEWMIPTAHPQQYRRIVTGQVVAVKSKITNELERVFFSFETAPDLALESVPAPKLSPEPATIMDDFTRWLARIKREYKGNVFDTRNQTEWERHLEQERGIDVGMLKLQLEFSRMEGSIDTAFLNFRNEAEFLQKFLSLTMDAEQAAAVRNSVITACDKLKRKPEFEKRLTVLTDLHDRLSRFAASASELMETKRNVMRCELHSAHVVSTLFATSSNLTEKANQCTETAKELRETIVELREKQKLLKENLNSVTFVDLKRKAERSSTVHDSWKEALRVAEEQIRYIRAAKFFASILSLRSQRQETYTMATLAEEGLKPFTDQASIQGKILKELLLKYKSTSENNSIRAAQLARQKLAEREQLKIESVNLSKTLSLKDRQLAQLQSEQSRYDDARVHWFRQAALAVETELLSEAIERIKDELKTHQDSLGKSEEREGQSEHAIKQIAHEVSNIKQQRAVKEESIKHQRGVIADAEALRESISQDRALCRAAESEIVDPDAEALPAVLDKYTAEVQRMRDACAVIVAGLNGDRTEIETTGLAGSNPDVQTVLCTLSELGIRTACAFNSYIAQTESNPDKAREVVLSSPAKFLGVAVKTEKELADAQRILEHPPALSKPVVVSLIANDPMALIDGFVVPADNDAAYNFASAKEYARELAERLEQRLRLSADYEAMLRAAIEGRQRLANYREKFSPGRLALLRQELASTASEVSELTSLIEAKQEELNLSESERDKARSLIKVETESIKKLSGTLKLIERDCDELEKPLPERLSRINTLTEELLNLDKQRTETEQAAETAYQDCMREERASKDYKKHAEELEKEILAIRHCDNNFDALASLSEKPIPLEAARELYANAAGALDYEERTRLGVLKAQLEGIERNLLDKEREYVNDFGDLDEERVRLCMPLDLDSEANRLLREREDVLGKFDSAKYEWAIAENAFKDFKRKQPEAERGSLEFAELEDNELLQKLEGIPASVQECSQEIAGIEGKVSELTDEAKTKKALSELFDASATQLKATIDCSDEFDPDSSLISDDPAQTKALVAQLIKENREAKNQAAEANKKADRAFQHVQKAVFGAELTEAEPDVAMLMTSHDFEAACEGAERLRAAVADRMAVAQGWLTSVKADFDATVEELHNLVYEGIRILNQACNKRLPEKAPYLGGKPVIRMKANLYAVPADQRRRMLEDFMDSIIGSGMPHKSGTDMVADAIQKIVGKSLGIYIAKLTREESEQYASADKLSNSGGEAVSMALFLYILTAQIRAEMQADVRQQPGGPLILDNPFAKASSPFIWRAQRAFARAMGVQLIFATATKDLETLGEFEHFVYLRKKGINNKTGRYHIEQVDLTLNKV